MTPLEGLQAALAAEHAALHVYGALGARTSASATPDLYDRITADHETHRGRRDLWVDRVRAQGGEPVAAEAVYELPEAVDSPEGVERAALEVERRCAATYAWLVEQTVAQDRQLAVTALQLTAVRALAYRGSPEILPGMASTRTARR